MLLIVLTATVLALPAIPASAGGTRVPRDPNIVDPAGDANVLSPVVMEGPTQVPAADILEAWFTNDDKMITAHWHVAAPPTVGSGVQLTLKGMLDKAATPIPGTVPPTCLFFTAVWRLDDGEPSHPYAAFTDGCAYEGDELWWNTKPLITRLADGSAIVSATVERSFSPSLRKAGATIDGINAWSAYAHWIAGRRPIAKSYDSAGPGKDYTVR